MNADIQEEQKEQTQKDIDYGFSELNFDWQVSVLDFESIKII